MKKKVPAKKVTSSVEPEAATETKSQAKKASAKAAKKTASKSEAGAKSDAEAAPKASKKAGAAKAAEAPASDTAAGAASVYQFRITLAESEPEIWRRIVLPASSTFWHLHVAIQDAMGWTDSHLHEFEVREEGVGKDKSKGKGKAGPAQATRVGFPDEILEDEVLAGWETPVSKYFQKVGDQVVYTYDFGDDWRHTVSLEGILASDAETKYPVCTGGARACPPEDSGGVYGYMRMIEVMEDPSDPDYDEISEWLGEVFPGKGQFDPEAFSLKKVVFSDAELRLKKLMASRR